MRDNFGKFILDCFMCFELVIISPIAYSIVIKSDNLRWLLYPTQWLFDIDIHTIGDIAEFIVGFCSLSLIAFFVINLSYKICKVGLSLIFMVCYIAFGYYFLVTYEEVLCHIL